MYTEWGHHLEYRLIWKESCWSRREKTLTLKADPDTRARSESTACVSDPISTAVELCVW